MRRSPTLSILLVLAGSLLTLGVGPSESTAQAPAGQPTMSQPTMSQPPDVAEKVAAALYDRGMVLFEQGDLANAKKMFGESIERAPQGIRSADALRMLRQCNEKLGIDDLDAGLPELPADGPLDPYGDEGNVPLDPYGDPATGSGDSGSDGPLDPYVPQPANKPGHSVSTLHRRLFVGHGGLQGFMLGMALVGPYEDIGSGEVGSFQGGAVALGLLGAGGVGYGAHLLVDKLSISESQSSVINSVGLWGIYGGLHLGNLFSGAETNGNDIYAGMAIAGLLGTGAGYLYAKNADPKPGDIAFTNSLGIYGSAIGLFLGVALDPPRGDADSLNALLGAGLGIGLGYYSGDHHPTRERMLKVDLGAAVGAAAPWALLYPFLDDGAQLSGLLSSLGIGAGGVLTWYLTDDDEVPTKADVAPPEQLSPALLQRSSTGQWSLATPLVRPMDLPVLAPRTGLSVGTDVLSGRF